jgi:hypothetical protein
MAVFLGQIIEKQGTAVPKDVEATSHESRVAANPVRESPRMVHASTTPMLGVRIEPMRNAIPINNQLPRTTAQNDGAHSGGNGHFHGSVKSSEEEQLPTMDELLAQLGAAIEEGPLLELAKPRSEQPPPRDVAPIPAKTVHELPVAVTKTAEQAFPVMRTIQPLPPVVPDTNEPGKSRQIAIRKILSSAAPFIFPTFVLIICVGLSSTQRPLSILFQVLIFASIIFSIIEIWRAGYGKR